MSLFGMLQMHSFLRELGFYRENLRYKSRSIMKGKIKSEKINFVEKNA